MRTLLKKVGFFIERIMKKLEATLINLFMWGELFSTQGVLDTTIIQCEGFIFEFRQQDIKLKQSEYINKTILTTIVTVRDITEEQIPQILEIIDDICWLLSFAQQAPICRHSYKIDNLEIESRNCISFIINSPTYIIENRGKSIRSFIEQVYPTYKELKNPRELEVVFGYLIEINKPNLAMETKLIISYVLMEHLKRTYAEIIGYIKTDTQFKHPQYPDLKTQPHDIGNYESLKDKGNTYYRHKKFGKCGSTEMIKRTFEGARITRTKTKSIIDKRNTMIHEGLLLPFGDPEYTNQAFIDFQEVNDLFLEYLLSILNYQGEYYLSNDRFSCSVCLI